MPTPDYIEGFEHQSLVTTQFGGSGVGIFDSVSNSGAQSFVAGRLAGWALRIVQDGVTAVFARVNLPATQSRVFSAYFKMGSAPTVDRSNILGMNDAAGSTMLRVTVRSAANGSTIEAQVDGGTRQVGPNVVDGAWHLLDGYLDTSGTTWTFHWAIDGVALTDVTHTSEVATDSVRFFYGSASNGHTADVTWDDVAATVTAGDHPLGPHQVSGHVPDSDGTHNAGVNIVEDNAGADIGVVTAFDLMDDWPPNTSDYVRQGASGSGNYAEVGFQDTAAATVWGVQGIAAMFASSTTAETGNPTTRIVDSTGATLTDIYSGDMSETSLHYRSAIIAAPGGSWTPTKMNGLKARVGFRADGVGGIPRWTALMLQVAVPTQVTLTGAAAIAGAGAISASGSVVSGATGTISAPTLVLSGGSTTDGTSFSDTLTSTPPSDALVLVALEYSRASASPTAPTTVVVAGVTLTLDTEHPYKVSGANLTSVALYRGTGAFSGTGFSVSGFVTGGAYTATGCRWDVTAYTGTKLTGTNGSDAIVQRAKNSVGVNVSDGSAATVSLPSGTPASSRNRCVTTVGFNSGTGLSPSVAGWTELSEDGHSGPNEVLESQYTASAFVQTGGALNSSGGGANMGLIIVELGVNPSVTSTAHISGAGAISATGVVVAAPTIGIEIGSISDRYADFETLGHPVSYIRIFVPASNPLPPSSPWSTMATLAAAGRWCHISFKANASWANVATGAEDARFTTIGNFLATIPAHSPHPHLITFHHEPEGDEGGPDATDGPRFQAAFNRAYDIIKPLAPQHLFCMIYTMGTTANSSSTQLHGGPALWWPSKAEVFGQDYYFRRGAGTPTPPWAAEPPSTAANASKLMPEWFYTTHNGFVGQYQLAVSHGVPMVIPELGIADQGTLQGDLGAPQPSNRTAPRSSPTV